ncbi:hypothetical protein ACLOJK_040190 [Asimina triloba]
MVKYLVSNTNVGVNILNSSGLTALDIVKADVSNSGALDLGTTIEGAGGKRSAELPPKSPEIPRVKTPSSASMPLSPPRVLPNSPSNSLGLQRKIRRERRLELHQEELQSARNTIIVVAVLIASVTFTAGINPPGGITDVTDHGRFAGESNKGTARPYKVFMISNNIALFLSLSIVIVLVSVIPFRRKSMEKLLALTHKLMSMALSFMAVAYIAATWVIMEHQKGAKWTLAFLAAIGGGSCVSIVLCLAAMVVRRSLRESKWRKMKEEKLKRNGIEMSGKNDKEDGPKAIVSTNSICSDSEVDSSVYTRDMKVCLV